MGAPGDKASVDITEEQGERKRLKSAGQQREAGGRKHGNYAKRRGLKLFCQKLKSCSIESWNVVQSKYGILFSETYGFLYYINNNPVWISGWYFAAGKQGILSRSRVSARTGAVRYLKEQGWG